MKNHWILSHLNQVTTYKPWIHFVNFIRKIHWFLWWFMKMCFVACTFFLLVSFVCVYVGGFAVEGSCLGQFPAVAAIVLQRLHFAASVLHAADIGVIIIIKGWKGNPPGGRKHHLHQCALPCNQAANARKYVSIGWLVISLINCLFNLCDLPACLLGQSWSCLHVLWRLWRRSLGAKRTSSFADLGGAN